MFLGESFELRKSFLFVNHKVLIDFSIDDDISIYYYIFLTHIYLMWIIRYHSKTSHLFFSVYLSLYFGSIFVLIFWSRYYVHIFDAFYVADSLFAKEYFKSLFQILNFPNIILLSFLVMKGTWLLLIILVFSEKSFS